jgi:hypothetical protein
MPSFEPAPSFPSSTPHSYLSLPLSPKGLIRATQSAEIFLLGSAALANLTFLADDGLVAAMLAADTPSVLLHAANTSHGLSVFTKDQVKTVLMSTLIRKLNLAIIGKSFLIRRLHIYKYYILMIVLNLFTHCNLSFKKLIHIYNCYVQNTNDIE